MALPVALPEEELLPEDELPEEELLLPEELLRILFLLLI